MLSPRNSAQNRVIAPQRVNAQRINPLHLAIFLALLAFAISSPAQTVNLFPPDYQAQWTRVAIPSTHPVSQIAQWHIDPVRRTILCDGDGGHEWLRFNHEFRHFTFHVKWRFTKLPGNPSYNSGVFFLNSEDGAIWHQAQTSPDGGYLFGLTPVDGEPQRFNEQKNMTENRVKPAGRWNVYDIRCTAGTCTLAVNGVVVNTIHPGVETGYIGLESEGYQIQFKDLKVQQLP
jgi:hypothetical protein